MPTTSWQVLQLASRALWVPGDLPDRASVQTAGVRFVDPTETEWERDAVVPTGTWRRLRTQTSETTTLGFRTDRDVALMRLPTTAASLPEECQVRSLGDVDRYFGRLTDAPGGSTTTIDPRTNLRLGLHLDNWDRLPVRLRHASRNRASVNLGPAPRAFLFVDLDVTAGHPPDVVPDTRSTRRLLQNASDPPMLLRLVLASGWAYIAPTENLMHDGSSLDSCAAAVHVSALGCFMPTRGAVDVTTAAVIA